MACCGQGRQTLRKEHAQASRERIVPRPTVSPTAAAQRAALAVAAVPRPGSVWLRYLASSPVRVVGPVTGRPYAFSGERAEQAVDPRDADALLATRHFSRAARV